MKFRRFMVLVLVLCMVAPLACAEDKGGTVLDWIEQKVDSAVTWASEKWKDASPWIEKTWGEASEWVERSWSDAFVWAADIWGDVSSWAAEKYDTAVDLAGIWWADTFKKVTNVKNNAWDWVQTESKEVKDQIALKYNEAVEAAKKGTAEAGEKIQSVYSELLKKLEYTEEDISKILETIKVYAAQKGISLLSMQKVMLPYLIKLVIDSQVSGRISIPPIAVAQFLIGIIEKDNLQTEEQAQQLIDNLDGILRAD